MSVGVATVPAVTGPVAVYIIEAGTALRRDRTGSEYTAHSDFHLARLISWGVSLAPTTTPTETAAERAARLASARSYVSESPILAPELSGNLIADVRALTGLTNQQLADATGVSERRVAGWRQRGDIPDERRRTLEALRTVGLTLYGGLGSQGTARWLLSGQPSPFEHIKAGKLDVVSRRLRVYLDSPAS